MRFEYDARKSRTNLLKHDIDFETAMLVFDDPYALTLHDTHHSEYEERYITLGKISPDAVLFVVHTWFENDDNEDVIRLISARAASSKERQSYEKAHKKPTEADRSRHRKKRRRD